MCADIIIYIYLNDVAITYQADVVLMGTDSLDPRSFPVHMFWHHKSYVIRVWIPSSFSSFCLLILVLVNRWPPHLPTTFQQMAIRCGAVARPKEADMAGPAKQAHVRLLRDACARIWATNSWWWVFFKLAYVDHDIGLNAFVIGSMLCLSSLPWGVSGFTLLLLYVHTINDELVAGSVYTCTQ